MIEERVMIFIDGGNLYHGIKEFSKRTSGFTILPMFNYYKFSRLLAKNRKLIRIYYYTALHNEQENPAKFRQQRSFLNHLRETPYCTVRAGHLIRRGETYLEKGVDVLLTVDMLRLARLNSYDTAILVSGDGDFVEAIKDVQEMGKQVELTYFSFSQSSELRNTCDRFIEITPTMFSLCLGKTLTMPETMMAVGK